MDWTVRDLAKMIDHSLLVPSLTSDDMEKGCRLAVEYQVASVCILPHYLKRCAEILKGSSVKASTTIGFPHGGHATATKLAETRQALADGGEELDMVVNVSRVLSGDWDYVRADIKAVVDAAREWRIDAHALLGRRRVAVVLADVVLARAGRSRSHAAHMQRRTEGRRRSLVRDLLGGHATEAGPGERPAG